VSVTVGPQIQAVSVIWAVPAVLAGIALLTVAIIAASRYILRDGGDMEPTQRVPQLYGYCVCLIAVVTFLFALANVVTQIFTVADPLSSADTLVSGGRSLRSFQAYKDTYATQYTALPDNQKAPTKPGDDVLRREYAAVRADHIASERFSAFRSLSSDVVLVLVAALLFLFHWQWLQRRTRAI